MPRPSSTATTAYASASTTNGSCWWPTPTAGRRSRPSGARTPAGEFLACVVRTRPAGSATATGSDPRPRVKRVFGEFTFRRHAWPRHPDRPGVGVGQHRHHHGAAAGQIRCHQPSCPPSVRRWRSSSVGSMADTVQPQNYAGCQYARRIAPGAGLSRHSWELALDLNIAGNPRRHLESQDPALVAAMTSRGFSWGGEWEYPDPGPLRVDGRPGRLHVVSATAADRPGLVPWPWPSLAMARFTTELLAADIRCDLSLKDGPPARDARSARRGDTFLCPALPALHVCEPRDLMKGGGCQWRTPDPRRSPWSTKCASGSKEPAPRS